MSVWLVVPVRSLRDGKSRLAPVLDPPQRRALIEWLLVRTLEQAAQFPGLGRTLLVSACEEARELARIYGAQVLEERGPGGLNNALHQAQAALSSLGAQRMLMVSCDLPLLQPEDLRHLSSAASAVTLAPDRARQGTNGLCLPTAEPFDFSFGPGSFERHVERVRRLDLACAIVDRAGLAFDIDTPEHLAQFNALQRRGPQPSPAIGG